MSRLVLILLALATAIPARAQGAGTCQFAKDEPPRRRSAAEAARDSLKSAIRDTLRTELLQAVRAAGVAQPAGIVFVQRTNRRTGEARVWSFRANVADSVSLPVVARRAALLARWPERDALLNFRLDPTDVPDDATLECMPALADPRQFSRELGEATRGIRPEPGAGPRFQLSIRMLVTRDGEVAYAELSRPTARGEIDRAVLQVAQRLRFVPADVDGVRYDVWVEQPVTIYVHAEQRERIRPK